MRDIVYGCHAQYGW